MNRSLARRSEQPEGQPLPLLQAGTRASSVSCRQCRSTDSRQRSALPHIPFVFCYEPLSKEPVVALAAPPDQPVPRAAPSAPASNSTRKDSQVPVDSGLDNSRRITIQRGKRSLRWRRIRDRQRRYVEVRPQKSGAGELARLLFDWNRIGVRLPKVVRVPSHLVDIAIHVRRNPWEPKDERQSLPIGSRAGERLCLRHWPG